MKDGQNFNWQGCGRSEIKAGGRTQHITRLCNKVAGGGGGERKGTGRSGSTERPL